MNVQGSVKGGKILRTAREDSEIIRKRAVLAVMRSPEGRAFVYDLLERRCLLSSQSYTGNSDTTLREGMRKVGIDLKRELKEDHGQEGLTLYFKMLEEQFNQEKRALLNEEAAKAAATTEE